MVQIENATMEQIARVVETCMEDRLSLFGRQMRAFLEDRLGSGESALSVHHEKPSFYTAREVCEMLGISRQTLHSWEKRGLIVGTRFGRTLRFPKIDIDEIRSGNKT